MGIDFAWSNLIILEVAIRTQNFRMIVPNIIMIRLTMLFACKLSADCLHNYNIGWDF